MSAVAKVGAEFPYWLTSRQAQAYVGSKSLKSYYEWKRRHGIIARNNGTVARTDIDRVLNRQRKPRQMNPASLANLSKRSGDAIEVTEASVSEGQS